MMKDLTLSLRLALRDWRAGELGLLIVALVVAVAAIASVGLFSDRMHRALTLEARQLIGADVVVASDRELAPQWQARAVSQGLRVAHTAVFPSMVMAQGRPRLASVKAVSSTYPLRGAVRITDRPGTADREAARAPAPGEIWLDPQLVDALGLQPGQAVQLGELSLRLAAVITLEPDRGAGFVNLAPRAMIAFDDLAASGLIQPASRVSWRLMAAGEPQAVEAFERWAESNVQAGQQLETVAGGRPELGANLDRAGQFLSLVALLSSMIVAVAIALAARRFAQRHLDGAAVMRSIGVRQARLARLLMLELCWIAIAGAAMGLLLGWLVHLGLANAVRPMLGVDLPAPGPWPAVQAGLAAVVLLLGFGAFPFLRLASVSPLRVLRRELELAPARATLVLLAAVATFALLVLAFSGDRWLALLALAGFAAGAGLFGLIAYATVRALESLRHTSLASGRAALRLAFASWSRRRIETAVQTAALAIGLMALVLLTVTRNELIDGWRNAVPADAPNRFVVNIQPDQRDEIDAAFRKAGLAPALYPMIRGRLIEHNGRSIEQDDYGERGRRMVEREFNLSTMDQPPAHNVIAAGKWFSGSAEASVESGIAETLGLSLGDEIVFDVAGERRGARITSIREVVWDSMQVNFFVILSEEALAGAPRTFVTAYHEPASADGTVQTARAVDRDLVERFPNLTVFDTGNLLRQVQTMIDQVAQAVQALFALTLAAGVVVLWAALASSRDERVHEAALMRALGASRARLAAAQLVELAAGGALAGFLAAAGAMTVGELLARYAFRFDFEPNWLLLPLGAAVGAVLVAVAGWIGLRAVLKVAPLATLRES